MRGFIPSAWASIQPPPSVEQISGSCLRGDGLRAGCLGAGTSAKPLVAFGGASEGRGARDPRRRRVGIGVAALTCCNPHVLGPRPPPP
eukprot:9288529-Pyramimonas_sp.AAC.1